MAKEPKPLTINAPSQGIAQSPHVGFGDMRNLDIFSVPGIVRLNTIPVLESAATVDAQVKWLVKNPAIPANLYALDSNGVLYTSADSGDSWAEVDDRVGLGQGLAIWKDYLFVMNNTTIDTYGPLSGSANWLEFKTDLVVDSLWHPALVSKLDGKLYIGAGRYVASLAEVAGQNFVDGDAGTYTWTPKALNLPEDYRIRCLAEQGNNLMIGTWQGTNIYDNKIADIFPWDGSSVTYGKPIIMQENGVNAMINIGGYLFIAAGVEGEIYKSNGVQAWPIAKIPQSIASIAGGKYLETYPGAICSYKDKLFFGIGSLNVTDGMGVYSLVETSKGTIINYEHYTSPEVMGALTPTVVGALLPITRDTLLIGWRDNATYGIDLTSPTSYKYTTDYKGYFESPLYQVGSHLNKRQFSQLEFQLAKELATDEGIQIQYRVNLTDTWITIGTYIYADLGKITSHNDSVNIPATDKLQIKVALLGTTTTTPEFKSLSLS